VVAVGVVFVTWYSECIYTHQPDAETPQFLLVRDCLNSFFELGRYGDVVDVIYLLLVIHPQELFQLLRENLVKEMEVSRIGFVLG
jgi:hypothetical protein